LTGPYRFLRADSKVRRRTSSRDFYFSCSPHASHFAYRLMVFVGVGGIATELRHNLDLRVTGGVPIWASPALEKPSGAWIQTARTERVPIVARPIPQAGIVKAASEIVRVGPKEAAPSL
jgi:hypothetical protein